MVVSAESDNLKPALSECCGEGIPPSYLRISFMPRLRPLIGFKNSIPRACDLVTNMHFKIGPGSFQDIRGALFVAGLSLFAIFLVKLFNARMQFIKRREKV